MGRYQSGQMGQTVNLLAQPSEVRILLSPRSEFGFGCGFDSVSHPHPNPNPHPLRGSSSFGRAEAFQASGGGFEPRLPLFLIFLRPHSHPHPYPNSHSNPHPNPHPLRLCSSGVEHFLGKEGVSSSILLKGSVKAYLRFYT